MDVGRVNVHVDGEDLLLLPERAVWWPARRVLLLADLHWGKTETLQVHGIGVPRGGGPADLARAADLVGRTGADRLIVLGDLVHARSGLVPAARAALREWARGLEAPVTLVAGNHDARSLDLVQAAGIEIVDDVLRLDPFDLAHDRTGPGTWSGHLHPVVRLGRGRDRLRLPCFVIGVEGHRLPAFSPFTGGAEVRPGDGRSLYACADDRVVPLVTAPPGGHAGA